MNACKDIVSQVDALPPLPDTALKIMSEHGDNVLEYIEEALGELPEVPKESSWAGMACLYLSYAVELWASSAAEEIEFAEEEEGETA